MIKILGLDVSSSCIGWAVLGVDNNVISIIEHGNIKPMPKDFPLVERLCNVTLEIDALCKRAMPNFVIIEEIIQYMPNKTLANTIITLAIFNRAVSLQVYKSTNILPLFILPTSIRAKIKHFLHLDNKIDKEDIPNILQNYFGKTFFKIVGYKKRGKNKGQPIVQTYDEADACAAALAGIIELNLIKD